ncbi:MAG: hypothetical protein SV375_13315 [Thermodesulfobacteriota bacterium]|nr:hypothetical protein [Thermodesulfobacteriota bacterium]
MRRVLYSVLALTLTLLLFVSCESTKGLTSRMKSLTSNVDDELFSQVPVEERQGVLKAEFDLSVAEEKAKLVDLKMKLAQLQKKDAGDERSMADKYRKKASVAVDLAKLEAIDRSGLGEKDKNIKAIANLKSKRLKLEADAVKIEARRAATEREIRDLTRQIEEQAEKIEGMKMGDEKETDAIESPSITKEDQQEETEEKDETPSGD